MTIASALAWKHNHRIRRKRAARCSPKGGDALMGYTGASVSIRKGTMVYTYNERGSQIMAKSVR